MTTDLQKIGDLPCWVGGIKVDPLSGGLSNASYLVTDEAGQHVVRFGHDYPFHHVDRRREAMTARAAHTAGFAPKVEFTAPGVMVSEFLVAKTWSEQDVAENPERLADLLRAFHTEMPAHISGTGVIFWVFHVIRDYARTLQKTSSEWVSDLPGYLSLAAELEMVQVPLPIIFGHNDLLAANILEDEHRLWLIDFEYAGYSTALFDLAGAASNNGMNDEQSRRLLERYFQQDLTADLLKSFDAMQCAALLREAMWSMVSQIHLTTDGVDFRAYAAENISRLNTALENYRSLYGETAK